MSDADPSRDTRIRAIILTEKYFRPVDKRIVEYIYVLIKYILGIGVDHNTIGVCQVQIKYWKKLFGGNTIYSVYNSLFYRNNIMVVSYYMDVCAIANCSDQKFLISYNGRPSKIYVSVFQKNLEREWRRRKEILIEA